MTSKHKDSLSSSLTPQSTLDINTFNECATKHAHISKDMLDLFERFFQLNSHSVYVYDFSKTPRTGKGRIIEWIKIHGTKWRQSIKIRFHPVWLFVKLAGVCPLQHVLDFVYLILLRLYHNFLEMLSIYAYPPGLCQWLKGNISISPVRVLLSLRICVNIEQYQAIP